MRWNQKRREKLASNHFLMCTPQSGQLRDVHRVIQRRKREEGDRSGQEDKRGESKGERQIQPVISSLSVHHHPEHTKRFTELDSEEKGEGGDRGDLVDKKESPKEERAVKAVVSLSNKNGLKIGFLKVQN